MPALKPTEFTGTILWLGRVPVEGDGVRSVPTGTLGIGFAGSEGERHSGLTRASCSRVTSQHPRGTEIANARQLTVLSAEEIAGTAARMGLDAIDPTWIGASIILQGLPDLTHLPPSSRLQSTDGTTLVVDMENRPCALPGREIEQERAGFGKLYKRAAEGRRGVTAWVERPGTLRLGDVLTLHVPDQRLWAHAEAVLLAR
ncbi:sulfurase [Salipiger aestuarii]|uniref:MOSC domain-containing protein n=1 Tax=Salipiger aestuarii TaxID=568098 RepID=A0A327XWY5_9RHOB|nr:MOSC domain-containing protein [Salipiger aestuarii]KAA8606281.1 sulfurase [Salipiger aestuarii]KAA8609362.1 sulfurase [Salipiger aestuarii]KAB2540934.1 sulfurase [Salipiger aestuarii]RAK12772.1 MOSC domain-containing protein [Salipiger aestuarii]